LLVVVVCRRYCWSCCTTTTTAVTTTVLLLLQPLLLQKETTITTTTSRTSTTRPLGGASVLGCYTKVGWVSNVVSSSICTQLRRKAVLVRCGMSLANLLSIMVNPHFPSFLVRRKLMKMQFFACSFSIFILISPIIRANHHTAVRHECCMECLVFILLPPKMAISWLRPNHILRRKRHFLIESSTCSYPV